MPCNPCLMSKAANAINAEIKLNFTLIKSLLFYCPASHYVLSTVETTHPRSWPWCAITIKKITPIPPSLGRGEGTISSLCHRCPSICYWLRQPTSWAVCLSAVHRILHVHREDAPSLLSSYKNLIFPAFMNTEEPLLDFLGTWTDYKS